MSGMAIGIFCSSCSFLRGKSVHAPPGVELIGELADGGGLHQSRDPLLSLAPVRQCRLDRGLARGREMGDALALVDVPNLDPNQAAAPTLHFFAPSHFSGRKGFFHSRSKISWVRFLI